MTLPAFAEPFGDRLPSADEQAAANRLRQILAAQSAEGDPQTLRVLDENNKPAEITLTPALSRLLMDLLGHIGGGDAVTLVPVSRMLTTQQAADILNVSRPYLIGLLERSEIAFDRVGRHRRIRAQDLFDYKKARDARRADALQDLGELDSDDL